MPRDESTPLEAGTPTLDTGDETIREIAREGARMLLQQALEAEIDSHVKANVDLHDEEGYRTVVRNGYAPQRTVLRALSGRNLSR